MLNLGIVKPGTTIEIPFDSFAGATGASITLTGLAVTDIEIYKDGSMTQRSSDNGYALLDTDGIDLDGVTGIHGFTIDLADNSVAGFYAAGSRYFVVVSTVTIDSQTVSFIAAKFTIGCPDAILNTTIASLSSQTSFTLTNGPAEDDALNGCIVYIHDVASAVQGGFAVVADYTGSTKTVTLVAGTTFTAAATDNISVYPPTLVPTTLGRTIVVSSTGVADANAVQLSGDATAADNLETAFDDTAGPVPHLGIADQGTAQSASSTGLVLRAAAAFADDTLIGCVLAAFGSTQGYWQFRQITDNALSGDTVTVDTWTVTPSGTITYKIFGSPPASATLLPGVDVTNWKGATAPAMTGDAYALVRGLVMANGTIGSTGNDTTHIHLTGLTYGNDEINNWLLVIRDVSEGEYHSRWIEDWVLSSALATVATLPFTPQSATDTYWLLPIRQDVTGGSGLDAAGVRAAIGLASANLDTQLGDLPTNSELTTALASADDAVLTAVDALPTNSELATALAAADDAVLAAIAALNNLSSAQVTTAVTTLMTTHGLTASRTGTAQAGAAGTITLDASASATDDIYNGMLARIVSGTGAGQWRPIYDYVGSTKVAHVKPNWTTTPDNTSVFAVTSCAAADFQLFEGKNTLSGSDRFTGL